MKLFRKRIKDERGFNLIELMIVIAIIALLIGVGIPAWGAMVRSGNETATIQALTSIRQMQTQYASTHKGKFAANFDELIKAVSLDDDFKGENPVVNGYVYKMSVQEQSQSQPAFFSINADPQVADGLQATGTRHFYFDSTLGTIKSTEENRPAKEDDPSI